MGMKKIILLLCIYLYLPQLSAQQFSISDSATISLITCSPGEETYSKFGHTALRVKDPIRGVDVVFNYGVFSFETDNFYYKFIKGETDYQLGIYETSFFLPEYAQRNSMVWEQTLDLRASEKRRLIDLLEENYKPENRIYRYNFVFDNCATRPRDIVIRALHGYVKYPPQTSERTFRQWIGAYVGFDTWLKFGIDVIFGLEADKFVTLNESMFLPEELMTHFQSADIKTPDGQNRKLVSKYAIIVNKTDEKTSSSFDFIKPFNVAIFLLVLGILVSLWDIKRKRYFKHFDVVILTITGLAGLIISYLMFFSLHPLVKSNLNILWLNPLNLIVAVVIWMRPLRAYLFAYQILNMVFLVGTLIAFALSVQVFNMAAFPIIVLLLIRATTWFAYTNKRLFKHRDVVGK